MFNEDAAGIRTMNRLRRSVLFMPGDSARKIEKAARLPCDCVAIDLEDGVAPAQKTEARAVTAAALRGIDFGGRERLVRINPASSDLYSDDLGETILANPDGYIIPKVETPDDVRAISHRMDKVAIGLGVLASRVRRSSRARQSPRSTKAFWAPRLAESCLTSRTRSCMKRRFKRARTASSPAMSMTSEPPRFRFTPPSSFSAL